MPIGKWHVFFGFDKPLTEQARDGEVDRTLALIWGEHMADADRWRVYGSGERQQHSGALTHVESNKF